MARKLPIVKFKGKRCSVDFKLEELRCFKKSGKGIKTIRFRSIKGNPKTTKIKKKLRGLRSRSGPNIFFEGIDT